MEVASAWAGTFGMQETIQAAQGEAGNFTSYPLPLFNAVSDGLLCFFWR